MAQSPAQSTAFDGILVQSRDVLRDRLVEGVGAMFDGAEATLTELADKLTDDEQKKRFLDARDLAISNREVIESHFRQRYTGEFQKLSNKVKKATQRFSEFNLDDLALLG